MPPQKLASKIAELSGKIFTKNIFFAFWHNQQKAAILRFSKIIWCILKDTSYLLFLRRILPKTLLIGKRKNILVVKILKDTLTIFKSSFWEGRSTFNCKYGDTEFYSSESGEMCWKWRYLSSGRQKHRLLGGWRDLSYSTLLAASISDGLGSKIAFFENRRFFGAPRTFPA